MRRLLAALAGVLAAAPARAGAGATYEPIPFVQDWSNTSLVIVDDDWSGCPGMVGFRGDGLALGAVGVDPQIILLHDSPGIVDVNANQSNPIAFSQGGVTEFQIADPVVALAASGSATAPYLVLHLNGTGRSQVHVRYRLRDIEGDRGTDNAVQPVALHFRTDPTGPWTNVPAAFVADATIGPGLETETFVAVTLPVAADDAPTLQIRWMTTNAAGPDESVGIDDISVVAAQTFVDDTPALLADAAADGVGVQWNDMDDDGDPDLFVVNNGQPDRFFRNDGGSWTDATGGALADASYGYGVAGADFDNDGDLDLVMNGGTQRLARNDAGTWVDAANGPLAIPRNGRNIVWGDFDLDGDVDLFMANDADSCRMFRNDAGTWVDVTNGQFGGTDNWQGAAAGDFDGDGDLDLYVTSSGFFSSNRLYRNDGGTWSDVTVAPLDGPSSGRGVAWGDYDNDGDLDLYVASGIGANRLYRNDGSGAWTDATSAPLDDAGSGRSVVWGDFDNDMDLDLFITNSGSENRLFRNDGGAWTDATTPAFGDAGQSIGAASGDFDLDGDLDLFVTNTGGPNRLLRNDASDHHWFHLQLVGVLSNRSAIGARARVVAGGVRQIREVSGGSGYASQNSLELEFGLGGVAMVESLTVTWPSGIVWDTTGVMADQRLVVIERAAGTDVGDRANTATFQLAQPAPNPFRGGTRVEYALSAPGSVQLDVLDLQGRAVTILVSGTMAAGRHSVIWDGKDASGREAATGIYFVRLRTGEGATGVRRVVVTR